MVEHENRKIEGSAPPALHGNGASELAYIDKRAGASTTKVVNVGPDTLTVEPVTITSGAGANTSYTLGAPTNLAAGQSTTIAVPSRMRSAGESNVRIESA